MKKRNFYFILIQVLLVGMLGALATQSVAADKRSKGTGVTAPVIVDFSLASAVSAQEESSSEYLILDNYPNAPTVFEEDEFSEVHLVSTDFLRKPSEVSGAFLDKKLEKTGLEGLGEAFKSAEQDYGVNAIFLIGLAMHESGNGSSRIAKEKNNLFGFQAYDATPYESAKSFSSREEGIYVVARYIAQNYLSANGKYFNGYSVEAMNVRYATDPNWARGVKSQIVRFLSR